MSRPGRAAGLLLVLLAGGGCAPTGGRFSEAGPQPDHLLPVDHMMSCPAIAESFRYAAARAARLQRALAIGPAGTFGTGPLEADAPRQIRQEQQRLDALSDLQLERGCSVLDPVAAIASERLRLGPPLPPALQPLPPLQQGQPVLSVRG